MLSTRWKTHAAAALAALAAVTVGVAPAAAAEHADPATTPILVVHGFDGGSDSDSALDSRIDCKARTMNDWEGGLSSRGFQRVYSVGYYKGDYNCDLYVPGRSDNTVDTSINEIARELLELIADRYGDRQVAISAHSMGGLVTRAAISRAGDCVYPCGMYGTPKQYLPKVYVSDVVTGGTPHGGADLANWCVGPCPYQLQQMKPGSNFLDGLENNPQGGLAPTDWTLMGSHGDDWVSAGAALSMSRGSDSRPGVHKTTFESGNHDSLVTGWPDLNEIANGLKTVY